MSIRPELKNTRKKGSVATTQPEQPLPYESNIPEPTTREELIKYRIPLSMDEKTAHKLLWISDGRDKVSRLLDQACPVLDLPERYEYAPQVMCKEGLLGCRGYWEVEYEGWVAIGVAYASSGRRIKDGVCGLGENEVSWAICWSGSHYQAWHDGESMDIHSDRSNIIGVYVDQPAGVIAFYIVGGEPKEAKLLRRYQTCFKEKILPGFWLGYKSSCWISKEV